jgi:uncharacterized repeat protein (TIGR01451 family)
MAMGLAGPGFAAAVDEKAGFAQERPQIQRHELGPDALAGVQPEETSLILSSSARCAAVANSPLVEPEWYASECVLGGLPQGSSAQKPQPLVPGDLFYLHNIRAAGTPPSSVYTSPIPTYNFTTLGPNALTIFAMDFDNAATVLWGINNTTRGLGTYNLTNGAFTQTVVTTGIPAAETIAGLKFDPTSSTVYVNSTIALYTLNITTGVATLVGPFSHATPGIIDIAIHPTTGQIYGEDLNDNFYAINKTTGATTLIGPMGVNINFAQGMDFDNSDGTLYQFAYIGAGVNDLRRINITTGASTLILNGPVGPEHEGAVKTTATPPPPPDIFINEVEPNDTDVTAQTIPTPTARVRANLFRQPFLATNIDVDYYKFTAAAGSRVSATTMTSFSSGSLDTGLDILAADGTTVIDTDNDDGALGSTSSSIGGALLATGGTYYVRVRQISVTSMSGRVAPYDLYVKVTSGTPAAEVEPNSGPATATPLPANGWASGTVDPAADADWFSFTANAGDTIIAIVDADPERDTPDWNPRLGIGLLPQNFFLQVDGSAADTAPSEAFMMTVKTTGTYYAVVDTSVVGAGGPTFTYHLAVSVIPAKNRTCTTLTGTTGPITDAGTTDYTVSVPTAGLVGYARLAFTATHPAPTDLDVTLIGPDGNEVFLFDDVTNNNVQLPQFDMKIEDEGGSPTATLYAGMHSTPEVGGRMEFFNGMQQQGNWILRVRDDLAGNTGTVSTFNLEVCQPAPRPACLIPGPQETTVFTTDFEANDGGFTHSGTADEWERGLPTFPPITSAHSGTNAWKTDLDNTYDISSVQDLKSAPIALTNSTGRITLTWWQKYSIETASFDNYWVEVRQVGQPTTSRKVFEWTGSTMNRTLGVGSPTVQFAAGWAQVQADISSFAGQTVEVIYHLNTDSSVNLTGVAIDDVSVTSCTAIVGQAIANTGITKTDNQTTYSPGQTITYTIVASNAGPSAITGATVVDNFPADFTGVSWSCTASTGSACNGASGTGDINATVNILSAGTVTFTATGTVSLNATGNLVNTATIANPAGTVDPDASNNSATDTDTFVALSVAPEALAVDTAGNNVYEPNETAVVAPTWRNTGTTALALTGALSNHDGPAGATYSIPDGVASYGTIAANATSSCATGGNCYSVANVAANRPLTHWDSTALETVTPTGTTKTWTLHIGRSFTDVPSTSPFYRFVETILHKNVTGGCGAGIYCPSNSTTREQMAVFVLVAREPAGYLPPACVAGSEVFTDVPASSPFCRWVEELARRGVVNGCGAGTYCASGVASREAMAVFVLRTLDGTLNPPACGATPMFADVPPSSPFCRWIEELVRRGVVTGCGGGNYCPAAGVTREQMAVFLTVTFGLTLYGL